MNTKSIPLILLLLTGLSGCTQSLNLGPIDGGSPDVPDASTAPDAAPDSTPSAEDCPCPDLCWRYADEEIHDLVVLDTGEVFFIRRNQLIQLEDSVETVVALPDGVPESFEIHDMGALVVKALQGDALHRRTDGGWQSVPTPPRSPDEGPLELALMGERVFGIRTNGRVLYELFDEGFRELRSFDLGATHIEASSSQLVVTLREGNFSVRHERMDAGETWSVLPRLDGDAPAYRRTAHVAGDLVVRQATIFDGARDIPFAALGDGRIEAAGLALGQPWVLSGRRLFSLVNPEEPYLLHEFEWEPNALDFVGDDYPWVATRELSRFTGTEWITETLGSQRPFLAANFEHIAGRDSDLWVTNSVLPSATLFTRLRGERVDLTGIDHTMQTLERGNALSFEPTEDGLLVGHIDSVALFTDTLTPLPLDAGTSERALYVAALGEQTFVAGGRGIWEYSSGELVELTTFDQLFELLRTQRFGDITGLEFSAVRPYLDASGQPAFWLLAATDLPLIRYEGGEWTLVPLPEELVHRNDQNFYGTLDYAILASDDTLFEWQNGSVSMTTLVLESALLFTEDNTLVVGRGREVVVSSRGLERWTKDMSGVWTKNIACRDIVEVDSVYWPSDRAGPLYFNSNLTLLETRSVE